MQKFAQIYIFILIYANFFVFLCSIMKKIYLLSLIVAVWTTASAFAVNPAGNTTPKKATPSSTKHIYTVVIDAGHGGKDVGALGRSAREKDLNLSVSLKTGQLIQSQHPEIQVVYTRTTDVFLPLQRRADIVNANNADLFICIHTNSAENKSVYGAETFVLGTEKMSQNLDVAMRENAVMKLEADYQTTYQGFDPNSVDSYIMFELLQNQYMDASLRFATQVQNRFVNNAHRTDRGVRQAAFWVLLKSACPSVLVEMGFISNPAEEAYLASDAGQAEIAASIAAAFSDFYKPSTTPKPVAEPKQEQKTPDSGKKSKENHSSATATPAQPATATPAQPATATPAQPATATPAQPATATPAQSANTTPAQPATATPARSANTTPAQPDRNGNGNATYKPTFAVQICAVKEEIPVGDERLKGLTDYGYIVMNGFYKYYTAASTDKAAVYQSLPEVRKLFPDAFVITLHAQQ